MVGPNIGTNVRFIPASSSGFSLIFQSYRCDAEPGALAEYILALLKHNVPENDMRRELTAQLDEFLEKGIPIPTIVSPSLTCCCSECSTFIDTLFKVLRTKTYLPYNTDSTPKQPRAMDTGIPIPLDALLSPSGNASPERGQKRSMDHDDRDGRPAKGPRLSMDGGQGQFSRYPNGRDGGQWAGHGGMNGHGGGMSMGGMGMNGGMNGNMGQMNGRRPQGYQPPDQKRGLCRDYHSESQFYRPSFSPDKFVPHRLRLLCTG
jgi:RNA-binding protein 26